MAKKQKGKTVVLDIKKRKVSPVSPRSQEFIEKCGESGKITDEKELQELNDQQIPYIDIFNQEPIDDDDVFVLDEKCFSKEGLKYWVLTFKDKTKKPTDPLTRKTIKYQTIVDLGIDPTLFRHTYAKEIPEKEGAFVTKFPNGNIEKGTRLNGKLEGLYQLLYRNGQIILEGNYVDGKKEGLFKGWQYNGVREYEIHIVDDKREGSFKLWYKNGNRKVKCNYVDDKLQGLYEEWYENGNRRVKCNYVDDKKEGLYEEWYDDKVKRIKTNYEDGKLNGAFYSWHQNKKRKIETYFVDGKLNGSYKKWYYGGELEIDCNYVEGKLEGLYKNFSGETFEYTFVNGNLQGPYKIYYENNIVGEGEYYKCKLNGPYKKWYEDGTLEEEGTYDNGILVGPFVSYNKYGEIKKKGKYVIKLIRKNRFISDEELEQWGEEVEEEEECAEIQYDFRKDARAEPLTNTIDLEEEYTYILESFDF